MKMQLSCGCCRQLKAVTIKGIDKDTGTTIWEYGPGSLWRHHYGLDAISGVVPDLSATLNKYAIAAGAYPSYAACGNRNAGTLAANVCEGLSVVKLNSLDGTTIESATLTGLFTGEGSGATIGLISGFSMTNAAALSGGDYVIVGERTPTIEFMDYSSNTATKEYILHAHGLIGGNVYLKTRTSNETITIPYNSDAGAVETLFEATGDCVSATATGGPWPLLPISIEVEWSASGGDISAIATTGTQSAVGGGSEWLPPVTGNIAEGIDYLRIEMITVSVGTTLRFSLAAGLDFDYVSETDDVATFILQLEAAMEEFAEDQGSDSAWEYIALGFPDSIETSGSSLTIYYSTELGIDPMTVEIIAGGDEITDSRNTKPAAIAYSTSTGEMTSTVGYRFGYSAASVPNKMFEESEAIPTVSGLNVLGISSIGSGPDNMVVVKPDARTSGDLAKSNVLEGWTIASGEWSYEWQVYCNAVMATPQIIPCESGYVVCPIYAKRFDGVRDRTAAKLSVADGAITEVMTTYGSITSPNNRVLTAMLDDTPTSYMTWAFDILYEDTAPGANSYTINDRGIDTWLDGDDLRIGAYPFGSDGSAIYASRSQSAISGWRYDTIGTNTDSDLYFKFMSPYTARSAEPQQFRFKLSRMPGVNYTAWLDWYATDSEIETAFNDLLGAGNVTLIDFGLDTTPVVNNPVAPIEFNLMFELKTDRGFTPGSGRIPVEYFRFRGDGYLIGGIEIEIQNATPFATPVNGMAAFNASDASLIWSRAFGTALIGGVSVPYPLYAWLQGDFVYAYGQLLENEL